MNPKLLERRLRLLEQQLREARKSQQKRPLFSRPSKLAAFIGLSGFALVLVGVGAFVLLKWHRNPDQVALNKYQAKTTVQLYYPSKLPNYFFMVTGSIKSSHGVLGFPIQRDDGQQIAVVEQADPINFDISTVKGAKTDIPNVGTMVVGSGFQGYRAVIEAGNTLIFMSSKTAISTGDLTSIGKSLKPVGTPAD